MADSGARLDLSGVAEGGQVTLDKHSTGGVGDKTSLVVVPIWASLGLKVCKMSGRGLGHTGGTLDKLEAIPGFRVALDKSEMRAQVARIGACLASQTNDLAPADRKLYALRDATATVGSMPLIVSSILSKKLAGGADAFVFDVKVGRGALVEGPEAARALAEALVRGARAHHKRAVALLTDMDAPLGDTIGNALEVYEAVTVLNPDLWREAAKVPATARFRELCLALAAEGLLLAHRAPDRAHALDRAASVLEDGRAAQAFADLVNAQRQGARAAAEEGEPMGANKDAGALLADPARILPRAPVIEPVYANSRPDNKAWVARIDARALGEVVVALGGGRARKEDAIDHRVGLRLHAGVGDLLFADTRGVLLAEIMRQRPARPPSKVERVRAAFEIADTAAVPNGGGGTLVLDRVVSDLTEHV
jgi:pyrimidine-nucleoside phosphorylase